MRYSDLDPTARYRIRVVYSGEPDARIRLDCNGNQRIHSFIPEPWPLKPLEFEIPVEVTRTAELTLTWHGEAGRGGNGRGCQVAEVWLIKERCQFRSSGDFGRGSGRAVEAPTRRARDQAGLAGRQGRFPGAGPHVMQLRLTVQIRSLHRPIP